MGRKDQAAHGAGSARSSFRCAQLRLLRVWDHLNSTLKALERLLGTAGRSLVLTGDGQAEDLWALKVTVCT